MSHHPRVAAVCGSLRDESRTRTVLRHALAAADDAGTTTDLLDPRCVDLPIYDGDDPDAGEAPAVRRRIREADAVVLGTPVYHHSYSSAKRVVLDYCGSDEFEDTVAGVVAVAGGGPGGFPTEALSHLRGTALGLRTWLYPTQIIVPNASSTVRDGEIADPSLAEHVGEFGEDLARCVAQSAPVDGADLRPGVPR